jgi:hypothetical protein
MNRIPKHVRRIVVPSLILLVGFCVAEECTDLFVPFQGEAGLTASQRGVLDKLRAGKTHEVLALVKIHTDAVGKTSVNLNLTADNQFRASHMTVEPSDQPGRLTWKGNLDQGAGTALFTARSGNLTGTISTPAAVYQVRPWGRLAP